MFRLFHSGYYVAPKLRAKTKERSVEYYEIELYTENFGFMYINGEKLCPKKNDVLISKPGDIRCSEGGFSCHSLKFVCTDLDYKNVLDGLPKLFQTDKANKLVFLFVELYRVFLIGREFECDALVRQICATLFYPHTISSPYVRYSDSIDKVVDYVCENIGQKLALEELAMLVNLSPSFLHKVFSSIMGMTIGEFILTRRIEKAKELLAFRDLSVESVACECGFSSRAYFDNTFKKRVGITPVDYRKSRI